MTHFLCSAPGHKCVPRVVDVFRFSDVSVDLVVSNEMTGNFQACIQHGPAGVCHILPVNALFMRASHAGIASACAFCTFVKSMSLDWLEARECICIEVDEEHRTRHL